MPPDRDTNPAASVQSPSDRAVQIGEWIHNHKQFTDTNPVGYTGYQYLRSAAASVPYGVSMAGTWLGFEKVAQASAHTPSLKYLHMFTASPLVRTGTMIGTSFSLYRATSKIGKWVNEYLFNPEDSLETTIQKVDNLPEAISAKAKEVYLPEFHSTLISSFVLGTLAVYSAKVTTNEHVTQALTKTRELLGNTNYSFKPEGWRYFWKEAIMNPKANFIPFAAINSLGYSLFFELGDRRFKDKQMSRGLWAGDAHSIGSSSKSHPSLLEEPVGGEVNDQAPPRQDNSIGELPEGSRMNDNLSILTSEPSFLRFWGRRFVPTAAGITIYSAIKMRGGYQFLGKFPDPEKMKTFGGFLENAWREGANTSLFFVVPGITDKYAPLFDKAVNTLEAKVSGRNYEQVVAGHQPPRPAPTVNTPADHERVEPEKEGPALVS